MRLWTIQTEEVYQKLLKEKIYRCDINKSKLSVEQIFLNSYTWMKNNMESILNIKSSFYPIWAWYKYNNKRKQPDLRLSGHAPSGTKCVCLEIEIDDNNILLSDFDLWHFILLDSCIHETEEEHMWFDTLSEEQRIIEKEKSWNKIFNINNSDFIQATFFELRLENIKKVKYFISK